MLPSLPPHCHDDGIDQCPVYLHFRWSSLTCDACQKRRTPVRKNCAGFSPLLILASGVKEIRSRWCSMKDDTAVLMSPRSRLSWFCLKELLSKHVCVTTKTGRKLGHIRRASCALKPCSQLFGIQNIFYPYGQTRENYEVFSIFVHE